MFDQVSFVTYIVTKPSKKKLHLPTYRTIFFVKANFLANSRARREMMSHLRELESDSSRPEGSAFEKPLAIGDNLSNCLFRFPCRLPISNGNN